jgi:hypothetical protein
MAGVIVPVIPKLTFDFGNFGTGTNVQFPLCNPIDGLDFLDAMLLVRLHSQSIGTGNFLSINLFDDGYIDGASEAFLGFRVGTSFVTILPSTPAPSLLTAFAKSALVGRYVTPLLSVNSSGSGAITATISVDLLLRSPDPAPVESWALPEMAWGT